MTRHFQVIAVTEGHEVTYTCPCCDREGIRNTANHTSLQQHYDAKNHWPCKVCDSVFQSENGLDQHFRNSHGGDYHGGNKNSEGNGNTGFNKKRWLEKLNPPFDGCIGRWILRENLRRDLKSFAWYRCTGCEKMWSTAHGFRQYKQACLKCKKFYFPLVMWINTGGKTEREDGDEKEDKPHLPHLCEACRHGECIGGRRARF